MRSPAALSSEHRAGAEGCPLAPACGSSGPGACPAQAGAPRILMPGISVKPDSKHHSVFLLATPWCAVLYFGRE